jgi:hypothetical protein
MLPASYNRKNCIRTAAIDKGDTYSPRQRAKPYGASMCRYCFTYAAAKVLQNFDIRKKIGIKKSTDRLGRYFSVMYIRF